MTRVYTEKEAEIYGKRRFCYDEGHDLTARIDDGMTFGGVQLQYDRELGDKPAACDVIKCRRCDAKFEVTYPEIGTVIK